MTSNHYFLLHASITKLATFSDWWELCIQDTDTGTDCSDESAGQRCRMIITAVGMPLSHPTFFIRLTACSHISCSDKTLYICHWHFYLSTAADEWSEVNITNDYSDSTDCLSLHFQTICTDYSHTLSLCLMTCLSNAHTCVTPTMHQMHCTTFPPLISTADPIFITLINE